MEKERLRVNETDGGGTLTWNSSIFMTDNPPSELNCSSELLSDCFFSSSWEPSSMDHHNDPFESALSSMVSSPVAAAVGAGDGFVIRELIGRLGSISDSGEISPQSRNVGSTNASSYNTPLNSPPKLNLSPVMESRIHGISQFSGPSSHPNLAPLTTDPGFAERAARFSCFGGRNLAAGLAAAPFRPEFGYASLPEFEPGKLSRVSSNQSLKVTGFQVGVLEKVNSFPVERRVSPVSGEMGDSREGSSVSELNPDGQLAGKAQNDTINSRKRKLNTKARAPAKEEKKVGRDNENAKRIKQDEDASKKNTNENCKVNDDNAKSSEDGYEKQHNNDKESAKPAPEPPKDYIHVRARRGQATDSHSLAERVRREKISERMKFLQDLVPGCNKVTGKAVVLDEIINYVQSLQRQVEFLSMKLATVNPEMEFHGEPLLSKDSFHSRGSFPPSSMYPLDSAAAQAFPYSYQSQQMMPNAVYNGGSENPFPVPLLNNSIRRTQMPSVDGFSDSDSQVPAFGGGDLHSLIQMSIAQNQTENLEGTKPTAACMKVEL